MREGAEMEMPLVGTPREAPSLVRSQQRLQGEERAVVMERQGGQLHGGRLPGGFNHHAYISRLPILEMCAGGSDANGASTPLVQRSAAVDGVAWSGLGGRNPVSSLSMEVVGGLGLHSPGYAVGEEQGEELGLLGRLHSLRIGDKRDQVAATTLGSYAVDPYGIWSRRGNESSQGILPNNHSLFLRNPVLLSDQEKAVSSAASQQHFHLTSSWLRPCRSPHLQASPSSYPGGLCSEAINLLNSDGARSGLPPHKGLDVCRNQCQTARQDVDSSFAANRTEAIEEFPAFQKKRIDRNDHFDVSNPQIMPERLLPNSPSGFSVFAQQKGISSNGYNHQSVSPVRAPQGLEAFTCEDSFIIQGNELHCLRSCNGSGLQREWKRTHMDCRLNSLGHAPVSMDNLQFRGPRYVPFLIRKYQSLMDIQGFIFLAAKDQHGCRFLQHKLDEGTAKEKEMIFNEIIDHVPELMVNPFGNYLMQKVLDACTENQRLEIILALTQDPTELVRISLNMHGTRAVQRLIETLKTKKETALVISALQPGFLSLIKDPNGNHVIQRCLQYFSYDDSKFILDAAARHCVDIARHRHGCCVLQRCISHSTGQHQVKLVTEVSRNGLILAQDAYGNYAVQYILDMKNPLGIENLKSEFRGNYVQLSMQKFSSNVVEKCLSVFDEIGRRRIISELLSVACFDELMQDPYANYVIQSALVVCKGHARSLLVDAIRPHDAVLKTSPYCKRIFNLLRK